MTNQPRIPEPETRVRHIAELRELNNRMDIHILDLDELNAQLAMDLCQQRRRMYSGRDEVQAAPEIRENQTR